jgi:hypothetical protein
MYTESNRRFKGYRHVSAHRIGLIQPLLLFTLGDIALTLLGEAFKTHLIWYMRFADLVDLLLVAPVYLVSLVWFHEQFLNRSAAAWLRRTFLVLAILLLYGHAMHVTANAINTFSIEIRGYEAILPADTSALIYFLDETLSHWIVFLTRFGLFACLLKLESRAPFETARASFPWGLAIGGLYGVWQAIVFTEGQKVLLAPAIVVVVGAVWLWQWRQSKLLLASFLRRGPATAFVAGLLPAMLAGLTLYALVVGSFTEPSKLGG